MSFIILIVLVGIVLFLAFINKTNKRLNTIEQILKSQEFSTKELLKNDPFVEIKNETSLSEEKKIEPVLNESVEVLSDSSHVNNQKIQYGFLENQFSQGNWLIKIGVSLLVLSIIWLVTYAFVNAWIGPVGRVFLGVMFGFALILFGTYRLQKVLKQGVAFLLGGAISFYISIFSGMALYEFYGSITALLVMFLVVIYISSLSAVFKIKELAISASILGFIAPAFVYNYIDLEVLFVYFFFLSLGTIWLDFILKWRMMIVISIIGVLLYSGIASFEIEPSLPNFIFVILLLVTFFVSNLSSIIKTEKIEISDYVVAFLTGIAFFFWMQLVVPEDFVGLAYILGAFIYVITSYGVYRLTHIAVPTFMYGAISLALLIGATGEFLSGSMFTLVLAFELVGLTIVSAMVFGEKIDKKLIVIPTILLMWPVALSFQEDAYKISRYIECRYYDQRMDEWELSRNSIDLYDDGYGYKEIAPTIPSYCKEFPTKSMFVFGLFAMLFASVAVTFYRSFSWENKESRILVLIHASMFVFYTMFFIWFSLHIIIPNYHFASMASLILFAVIGGILYGAVESNDKKYIAKFGMAIIIGVLLRFFVIEFWEMEMVARIITSFIIGLILIGASMHKSKKKDLSV
ncbi:MAG: DUF2339 domain-containing protein [Candidatus Moraniibacteriota bacterium]|nr:MAG: DUF2339 domain-containing protein [Candidatus Moranbacteria bacterium]